MGLPNLNAHSPLSWLPFSWIAATVGNTIVFQSFFKTGVSKLRSKKTFIHLRVLKKMCEKETSQRKSRENKNNHFKSAVWCDLEMHDDHWKKQNIFEYFKVGY